MDGHSLGEDSSGALFRRSSGEAVFIEWDIPNFESLLQDYSLGGLVQSPTFQMRNASWKLGFVQDGRLERVSVVGTLKRLESEVKFHRLTYQITLKINGEEIYEHFRTTSNFKKRSTSNTFIIINQLDLLKRMSCQNLTVLFILWPEVERPTPQKVSNADAAKTALHSSISDAEVKALIPKKVANEKAKSRILSSVSNQGTDILISRIKSLFVSRENSDFTLKVGDKSFPVHKAILSAWSPVLSAMFHNETTENNNCTADIADCEPDKFEKFLLYIYSGQIEELSWDNVIDLYTLGDKYDLEHLRAECVRYTEDNLCIGAFCDAIRLAVMHNLSTLLELVKDFFQKNVTAILLTAQWQLLMKENPDICNELFIKFADNSCRSSAEVKALIPKKVANEKAKSRKHSRLSNQDSIGTDILISRIKSLFLNGENSDFTLKVGDRSFAVHKAILSAWSPVLSAMFRNETTENNSCTADIADCGPDKFERFLLYIYSGQIEELSWDNVIDLYTLGDKYDLEHLRMECVRYMEDNLCIGAFCDAIRLTVRHNLSTLLELVKDFFQKNVNALLLTAQWQLLMKENPDICNELFITFATNSKV